MHIQHAFIRSSRIKVLDDICPACGGDLDTGWECNACRMDWYWTAFSGFGLKTKFIVAWQRIMFSIGFRVLKLRKRT